MAGDADLPPGLHFAGVNTRLLVRYLREHEEPGAVERVLSRGRRDPHRRRARRQRHVELLRPVPSSARGDRATRSAATPRCSARPAAGLTDGSQAEMTAMLQSLGSPSALLGDDHRSRAAPVSRPSSRSKATKSAPTEWVVREWFAEGFEPFREYCSWAAGLYSNIPTLFGLRAEVDERSVRVRRRTGVRVPHPLVPRRRRASPPTTSKRASRCLTARLEGLQQIVGELVSDDDLERVLTRIVVSAARTHVGAGVRARARSHARRRQARVRRRHRRRRGRTPRVRAPRGRPRRRREPPRRRSAVEPSALRTARPRSTRPAGSSRRNGSCSRPTRASSAAALDSAAAVEEARRQAESARALLELSNSLAEIATTDEMAAHIARAVTAVIGCDRAAVILFEPERGDRPGRRDARLLARRRSAAPRRWTSRSRRSGPATWR